MLDCDIAGKGVLSVHCVFLDSVGIYYIHREVEFLVLLLKLYDLLNEVVVLILDERMVTSSTCSIAL